jgi:anthranilate synthase component 2
MIVLIDNYDSFTYNLYQMLGALEPEIMVFRNDALEVRDLEQIGPSHIVISPGPGRPKQAGISEAVIRSFAGRVPLLGVCLGHQAICEVFGADIGYAPELMHGKASEIEVAPGALLFAGLPERLSVGRYHSLVAEATSIPDCLKVTAQTAEGVVMAVEHRQFALFGLQFHPESILTPAGQTLLVNFLSITNQGAFIKGVDDGNQRGPARGDGSARHRL